MIGSERALLAALAAAGGWGVISDLSARGLLRGSGMASNVIAWGWAAYGLMAQEVRITDVGRSALHRASTRASEPACAAARTDSASASPKCRENTLSDTNSTLVVVLSVALMLPAHAKGQQQAAEQVAELSRTMSQP
ncbi:hypothetical protein [Methylobacterium oryzisoli]|uniref:hypothetical protein n=1 Tax=Methylobacterium oryzisoli TaxID=3385502 RepID=UPI003891538D